MKIETVLPMARSQKVSPQQILMRPVLTKHDDLRDRLRQAPSLALLTPQVPERHQDRP